MPDHAAVSPSSAAMWLNCPASITKAEGMTRPSSQYAKEGTAAHAIAEMIIDGNLLPPGKIEVEGTTFVVGLPMLRALHTYVDFVQALQDTCEEIRIEQRVKLKWAKGMVWGTTDCAAKYKGVLDIVDLKYGKGVPVTPDSAQLKIYALASMHTLWPAETFETVRLTVVQPRMNPDPMTHTMTAQDLYAWGKNDLRPALDRITQGDQEEKAGAWCRWCVRKNVCATFAQRRADTVVEIFNDGLDIL